MNNDTDGRCTSLSEDGRRCHGDVGHRSTHWAAASRVWSDTETLVRPQRPMFITEFLLARIAEDEATAGEVHWWECGRFNTDIADERGECDCGGPARVLAECEAKRRIVEEYVKHERDVVPFGVSVDDSARFALQHTLRALAAVYADHPDYDDSWRP